MYKDIVFLDGIDSDYSQSVRDFIEEWESQTEIIKVNTSGSTGPPQEIELLKTDMERSARATGNFFNFRKSKNLLLNLSPEHIAGKMMIVRAILHEMKIVVGPLTSNPLEAIRDFEEPIYFGAFVPNQIVSILKDPHSKELYERIERVIIGGARLDPSLIRKLELLSNESYATFGMTETISHFAILNLSEGEKIYSCLPGFKVSVGENSCLIIRDTVTDKVFKTKDVVVLKDENSFLWMGRTDNVINSGGIKIFPEELEKIFGHVLKKKRFYFAAKKDEKYGEVTVLIIEGEVDPNIESAAYKEKLRALPKYFRPKEIIFEQNFDETKNGKIIRKTY